MFGTVTNCGSTLICTPCVCVYVSMYTQPHIFDLSFSDITNCCVYTIIQAVNHHNHYLHQTALTHLTPANHHNHYIHSPALTQLTPTNHQKHYTHHPALTQLTPTNHHGYNFHHPALTQLTPTNPHNHYIHHPALTQLTPANLHNHYIRHTAITQLNPSNHHNHYIHHPALTHLNKSTLYQSIVDPVCSPTNSNITNDLSISVDNSVFFQKYPASGSTKCNKTYKQISSVPFEPCS